MIAVEVDVVELPGVLAALLVQRCIRHDSPMLSGVCSGEKRLVNGSVEKKMQLGFLGYEAVVFSPLLSCALLDRTWERWSGVVVWWGSVFSYVETTERFCYEEALLVHWKSGTSSPLFS